MSYLPVVDEGTCIGQADCAEIAPSVFAVDDRARVIGAGPDELILTAARECPVQAITIIDSETGERVYP